MTRSDLITRLAERFPALVREDATMVVKEILDAISTTLVRGGRIEIRGFGAFRLNYRPPRHGRNPATGTGVAVPGKYAPSFRAGKELREALAPLGQRNP